jgi:hypothetical protein
MSTVTVKCDLCPETVTVSGRVETKIGLPEGWIKGSVDSEHHRWFDRRPGPKHFCSSEHSQAFAEAVRSAAQETMQAAKEDFARRLKLKKQAAISVVDALATLAPEESGDDRDR